MAETLKLYFMTDDSGFYKGCVEMLEPRAVMFANIKRIGIAFTVGERSDSAKLYLTAGEVYFIAMPDQAKLIMGYTNPDKYIGLGLLTPIWGDSKPFAVPPTALFSPLPGDMGKQFNDMFRDYKTSKMESFAC